MRQRDIKLGCVYRYQEPHQPEHSIIRIIKENRPYLKGLNSENGIPYNHYQSQYITEATKEEIQDFLRIKK